MELLTTISDTCSDAALARGITIFHEVYAIPTQQSTAIMYYNKAIFDKYGLEVPTTYDEYALSGSSP